VSEDKGERESKVATPAVLQQIKDFKGLKQQFSELSNLFVDDLRARIWRI
jgi:hypothetical protein